jgi:hypothetical protein
MTVTSSISQRKATSEGVSPDDEERAIIISMWEIKRRADILNLARVRLCSKVEG